ncbi:hydrogenase 4 subunit B [Shimwellia blattae]|uniref:Hydrogenase-4 component B n=1 Tax=Shimwellia blattae (strain ATCC 29907 / DSM 4481 / JCM 1650 / NBRC 105725 / CDC 9005-74) TaxID=630626 RepID=I2BDA5_SHIBC|nr:hydrogenase 4 subunit B [Shimwellia blattae]AFJ48509.1 hydrogenase-4 component B [Shimwellia blattae DSM 4481 = NBRC 105725]GAB83103.1 NiFe-hydrogenase 4 component B [Shimwellia blattae DSM 4481 = NBRC 105725]VDY66001.1 Hydrogenase-4 component B [Shimwellia blattae]VEC26596.1 Hydrogenase-4 component B [Shimwellia blattae]
MDSLQLLLWSVVLYLAGAVLALLTSRQERTSINLTAITAIAGGILGLCSAIPVLLSGDMQVYATQGIFPFAAFSVRLDMLSAFMVMVISLLVVICSLYSIAYVREYEGRGAGSMGFFMNLFIASMVGLVVMDNAFYFIILFEAMSLASWFLVISEQDKESVSAGLLYFFIAHAGSVLIMIAFFLMWRESGSLDFDSFRRLHLSPAMASVVFLLAFFGFGAKAGMLPLHSWLPRAHPAAPSHASALMSGVMVKIGIFGIIKVGIDLLGAPQQWWGIVVLGFGAVSSVLGVLYALAEHDIKRLLAWHTVENVGIILMGVGVGMVGIATHHPVLAAIGLLGALYHLLNHAVFKGLLFLGAGAMIYRLHTRDMERMGGLGKLMPLTATAFLIGCMAISALPPLNGFISEWYTYQSLFSMSHEGSVLMRISAPVAIVMLAITGALAAMCFVKVYGISFCGGPRSEQAAQAREVPWPMTAAMLLLALCCVALGLGASVVAPVISQVAMSLANTQDVAVTQGSLLIPAQSSQAMLSPALTFILLVALPVLPLLIWLAVKGNQPAFRRRGQPWACGYNWEPLMASSAGSFTQPLRTMFSTLYRMRKQLDPSPLLSRSLQGATAGAAATEPFWDEKIIYPLVRLVRRIGSQVQRLQGGDFRLYCLYVVAALVVLLLVVAA